jgi:hypothetical protein
MSSEPLSLTKGQMVTVTDKDGKPYERRITAIHYPSTLNGEDCIIIRLAPVVGR